MGVDNDDEYSQLAGDCNRPHRDGVISVIRAGIIWRTRLEGLILPIHWSSSDPGGFSLSRIGLLLTAVRRPVQPIGR